jgi:hypothetical protein
MLLVRQTRSAAETIAHLVGMQAQIPTDPYYGLWTRLVDFNPRELSDLIADRKAVRLAMMRSTIHLVTARDCLQLRPVVQSVQDRVLFKSSPFGRQIVDMDIDALVAAGRAIVDEQPRTMAALGKLLQERWPDRDRTSMAYGIRAFAPLVQVPPRGLWDKRGQTTLTTAEHWLGQPLAADDSPDELILRYLGAFGPATVGDAQYWSGLTGLKAAFERLRPRLVTYRDERGRELFDLPDAPRPDPDVPAPPRFLPQYDNVLIGHDDRARVADDDLKRLQFVIDNRYPGTILIDGFLAGIWIITWERKTATIQIRTFAPLSKEESVTLEEEANRLLEFAAAHVETRIVQFLTVESTT